MFRKKILDWYDRHRRVLPWRALKDQQSNPYHVWLSEIMLQQTTVQAVIPYFNKFITLWPEIDAMAQADNQDIMNNWAGLGYYARARNLHKCAKVISEEHGGIFPHNQDELKKLPGIGDYTSAAIASIAFNIPANVVDGNVERVMARYHACSDPLPQGKKTLKTLAQHYTEGNFERPGDYAQSLMDLGATICTPKSPVCSLCPINKNCQAYANGEADKYPIKAPKKAKPRRHGYAYYIHNQKKEILLQKRPDKGLLGGMYGLPTTQWVDNKNERTHLIPSDRINDITHHGFVEHVFTHFHLKLDVYALLLSEKSILKLNTDTHIWASPSEFETIGFPTVFQKALNLFK
ncbi:MAG: A/G-specific adenine glycosylase [Alphaproteobacteria bacterium]